jgi:hypothetical protein
VEVETPVDATVRAFALVGGSCADKAHRPLGPGIKL